MHVIELTNWNLLAGLFFILAVVVHVHIQLQVVAIPDLITHVFGLVFDLVLLVIYMGAYIFFH